MSTTNKHMLDGAPSFVIKSIVARQHPGYGMDIGVVEVEIITPSKLFAKLKNKGDLGSLYLDVSNELYSLNNNIPAYCPTVSSENRASGGLKTITLYYKVDRLETAKALGLPVFEFKNGWSVKYMAHVDLMEKRMPKPALSLVR